MRHPPHSTHLAPSDNRLFPNLKQKTNKHLRGQGLSTDDELKSGWGGQSELFYFTGIEKLRDRYKQLCIYKFNAMTMLKNKRMLIRLLFI